MALNITQLNAELKPITREGEKIFFVQDGVSLSFTDASGGYPGNCGSFFSQDGVLYLTNRRTTFLPTPAYEGFRSLEWPLENYRGRLFQPWFGSSRYEGVLYPAAVNGIKEPGDLKLTFSKGGGFEFSNYCLQLLQRLGHAADPVDVEPLPPYAEQTTSNSSASASASNCPRVVSSLVESNPSTPNPSTSDPVVASAAPPHNTLRPPSYDEI